MDISGIGIFFAAIFGGAIGAFLISFVNKKKLEEHKQDENKEIANTMVHTVLNDPDSPIRVLINEQESKFQEFLVKSGEINNSLQGLTTRTDRLNSILFNPSERGKWGELLAERLLEIVDYKKGVDFDTKQIMSDKTIPDFTFYLPEGKTINMDSKFPLSGYTTLSEIVSELNRESDIEKRKVLEERIEDQKKKFMESIKDMISKEIAGRGYISPEEGTVDYALMYVPIESVYSFLIEQKISRKDTVTNKVVEESIVDFASRNKIIIVSPATLMAYLETIRTAVRTFSIQSNVKDLINIHGEFKKQWVNYLNQFTKVKSKLEDAQDELNTLITTREKALDTQVEKMERLGLDEEKQGN